MATIVGQAGAAAIDAPDLQAAVVAEPQAGVARSTTVPIVLGAMSFCHMLNDTIQSLLPAIYPILAVTYSLSFTQIGFLTLAFQMTASVLQPIVGLQTDRRPMPFSLPVGMGFSLVGLVLLATAGSYPALLFAAAMVGLGSSIFHPEAARVARLASGGRHGLAQSVFQVGGNAGTALGPLLAAFIVLPHGQIAIAWFCVLALLGMAVLARIGVWYRPRMRSRSLGGAARANGLPRHRVGIALAVLVLLVFSKHVYLASMGNFFTFYLIEVHHLSVRDSQLHLFLFLGAVAVGTIIGGPLGDRFGRKRVIWGSILGVLPLTAALPYVPLPVATALTIPIGVIIASAFPAIVVYAQELLPGRVGLVAGLFFGLAFGFAAIGAALLGTLADHAGIQFVFEVTGLLPILGLLTALLPDLRAAQEVPSRAASGSA